MPVVEQALAARLEGSTSVTSLASTRIYPMHLPQDPRFPAVTYDHISGVREWTMNVDPGTVTARMQVTSWAKDPLSAANLMEGVRAATQRWAGTSTGVVVDEIFIENEFSFYDDDTSTYAHSLDLIVHYQE